MVEILSAILKKAVMIMKMRSFKFYLDEAFDSLIKNKLMAFASAITVASCIFILSISFCIAKNINYALVQLNDAIGLSVIISDNLSSEKINTLYEKISSIPYVSEVKFVSAEEALEELSLTLEDSAQILKGLKDDNPLPRSFDITLKDNRFYSDAIESLENLKSDGIANIKHAQEETNILLSISRIIHVVSAVIILSLALISVIIIMNTIKLAVNSRKDEISIMKYIGATNWFIRWPFIIEGMIIGFIGSLIPILISWPCYDKLVVIIYEKIPVIKKLFEFEPGIFIFSELAPIALALGVMIGIIGSFSSVRKYLNV